jgi:hypothetical protein
MHMFLHKRFAGEKALSLVNGRAKINIKNCTNGTVILAVLEIF